MPRFLIRVDASVNMGVGHVMRCLTLAIEMKARGCRVDFICRPTSGNQIAYIERQGFRVHRLSKANNGAQNQMETGIGSASETMQYADARQTQSVADVIETPIDVLVVDHYGLDCVWERQMMRHTGGKLFVIDDMANRVHDCDFLLDQNYYPDMNLRYDELVPERCTTLLGPEYAMLRREFTAARRVLAGRNGDIKRLLVMFGGTDPSCATEKTLDALGADDSLTLDVVVGSSNPRLKLIEKYCSNIKSAVFHCQPDDIARLMMKADVAVGAGGSSSWERCCLGIPCLVIATAKNQEPIANGCEAAGVAVYLGLSDAVGPSDIAEAVDDLRKQPEVVVHMRKRAMRLVTGDGVSRIADILEAQYNNTI